MGALALAAAIVSITLPETHKQPTMENLLQVETSRQGEKDVKLNDHRDEKLTTAI